MLTPERWLPLREQLRIERICYPDTWGGNQLKGMTAYVISELLADLKAALKLGYRCEAHEDDMAEGRCVCCEVAQVANLQERLDAALETANNLEADLMAEATARAGVLAENERLREAFQRPICGVCRMTCEVQHKTVSVELTKGRITQFHNAVPGDCWDRLVAFVLKHKEYEVAARAFLGERKEEPGA